MGSGRCPGRSLYDPRNSENRGIGADNVRPGFDPKTGQGRRPCWQAAGKYGSHDGEDHRGQTMSSLQYRSSKPDKWTQPRPFQDASLRLMTHGPIVPMEQEDRPGLLRRLFRF
jgi:hypothetical protein